MHLLATKNVTAVNNFGRSMFLVHGPRGG